jgi:hypothetical protein
LKIHLHHFSKIKSPKEVTKQWNQGFSYCFCLLIEGSRYEAKTGSIPQTNGSGSGRPKIMWNWWIRIRIQIRNTERGRQGEKVERGKKRRREGS